MPLRSYHRLTSVVVTAAITAGLVWLAILAPLYVVSSVDEKSRRLKATLCLSVFIAVAVFVYAAHHQYSFH